MPNAFITPTVVLNEGLMMLENELVLGAMISNDYSSEFQSVGNTINIRRPQQYTVIDNNLDITGAAQDIEQATVPVTLTKTATVPVVISAMARTLSFDRFSEDIVKPAMIALKDKIEASIAAEYYKFYNFSGTPGTAPTTFLSLANPGALLDDMAVPMTGRVGFHTPTTAAALADGLKGVFVQSIAKTALEKASFGEYANFDHYKTVHAPLHTVGVKTGTPLIIGGAQNVTYATSKNTWSQTLLTDGWTNSTVNIMRRGDVFTIASVFSVNPVSKLSTGRLQHFTEIGRAHV